MAVDVGDTVSLEVLQEERRQKFFLGDGSGVLDEADAAAYVAERGFRSPLFARPIAVAQCE